MAFPLPTFTDCNGFLYCLSTWANEVTDYTFFPMLLIGFCIVLFMASYRYGTGRAFGFASFGGALGSLFLVTLQLMSWVTATMFIVAGAVGLAVMIIHDRA